MDAMMNANREEELLVAERAAEWLDRLKKAGPQERAEFFRWLKDSPRHVREMLLATTLETELPRIDPERRIDIEELLARSIPTVIPVRPSGNPPAYEKPRRWTRWSWIASVGTAVAMFVLVLGWSGAAMNFLHPNKYGTAVGEQRAIELADGSVIHLNTQSRVRVDFSHDARDVYLQEGQAIFKVKRDSVRPFRVHVDRAVIQAIGTQFDVHRLADRTDVAVIEGSVQVVAGPSSPDDFDAATLAQLPERIRIAAGEAISIAAGGEITPPAPIDVAEANAWQQRRLIFRKSTLAEIVAEFNRYNRAPQIRVEGETLRARRFSGVFDADDPESLLKYLASDSGLVFDRQGHEIVIRPRSDTALVAQEK